MKELFTLLALIATTVIFAQAPQGFNYQATVRNSTGAVIANQNVYFKFNVMLNSATSLPVFSETHYVPTDDLGQVNLVIGTGTATTGTFSSINWASGSHYLGIELNTGAGYVAMGTTQLLSVPYALYANSSGNTQAATPNLADVLAINNVANNLQIKNLADPTDAQDAVTKSYIDDKIPNGINIGDVLTWNGTSWSATISQSVLPSLSTFLVSSITYSSATSGGDIYNSGGSSVTARGVCYGTQPLPTISGAHTNDGIGTGIFSSNLSGLIEDTTYYIRSYATNNAGTAYGGQQNFTTSTFIAQYPTGSVFCGSGPTEIVTIFNPITGRTWMDRDLGASQVATSISDVNAFGDFYQWGRGSDGHQCVNSSTTTTLSSTDQPGNANFILAPGSGVDWRSPENINLWQGVNGINNPCPNGFRIPTKDEWNAEINSWNGGNASSSLLKLTLSGNRRWDNGEIENVNIRGSYWSSSTDGGWGSHYLEFDNNSSGADYSYPRSYGRCVRCIKD